MLQSLMALGALIAADRPPIDSAGASGPGRPAAVWSATGRRSHRLLGAAIGFGAGATATYLILHQGGSTAPCDRSANQDAIGARECFGLVVAGGAVGAALGALVGGLIKTAAPGAPVDQLRIVPFDRRLTVSLAVKL